MFGSNDQSLCSTALLVTFKCINTLVSMVFYSSAPKLVVCSYSGGDTLMLSFYRMSQKAHFLNCRFAKPGLRVHGLPLPAREGVNGKKRFLSGIARIFGPLFRSAFLVNKKSLFLQKCQCIELLTVF